MPSTYNLADLFAIAAATVPEREAVVCGEVRRTFAELEQRAGKLALWLRAQGVGAGDTVGIQMYNAPEYIETFFAALKLKALPFNINYRYVADELRYLYDNAAMKALVFGAEFDARVAESLSAAPDVKALLRVGGPAGAYGLPSPACGRGAGGEGSANFHQELNHPLSPTPLPHFVGERGSKCDCRGDTVAVMAYDDALAEAQGSLADIALASDDLSLLYTGGTTGMPKGVAARCAVLRQPRRRRAVRRRAGDRAAGAAGRAHRVLVPDAQPAGRTLDARRRAVGDADLALRRAHGGAQRPA